MRFDAALVLVLDGGACNLPAMCFHGNHVRFGAVCMMAQSNLYLCNFFFYLERTSSDATTSQFAEMRTGYL